MNLWTRIPIVTLILAPACQGKTDGQSTDTASVGSETGSTSGGMIDSESGSTTVSFLTTSTDGTESSDSSTASSESEGTTGGPEWPQVVCGQVTCRPGDFCMVYPNECSVITDPCGVGDTTGGEPGQCVDVKPGPRHCKAVPPDCENDPNGIGFCLEGSFLCPWSASFSDGFLFCSTGFYGECGHDGPGPYEPYCMPCLHEEEEDEDLDFHD